MIQFYAPDIATTPLLPEQESLHCCRVLRMKKGDNIFVTDGKGKRYRCEILNDHPSHTEVKILETEEISTGRNYTLTLAVAPTKNFDRMEWLAEKAVEIGVDKIVLLKCDRSERKILRAERLQKIMVSAMKQSLSTYLPQLEEADKFDVFIKDCPANSQKFFGYCSSSYPRKELVKECKPGGDVIIMIGPEGDFTLPEVEKAVDHGFLPVTFGNQRLRTETAGVYATCAVNVINEMGNSNC